ncbi:family 6 glucosyltransferase [uncultured Desulfovibrio sp.]|uniref:family 6 glucosyltransferase n=1 Tax=uncultured Desulfovibrio sp. TaxID=167968 RepID=UPI0026733580|nr:family 6 glucosyltransferase [uncultured Desulfovibrio sp.]
MAIAVLYICTGRYTVFWAEFYTSCEEFFFKGHTKEYFVFTDGVLDPAPEERVHCIKQGRMGWPHDTLQRFKLFENLKSELEKFDLIFFCNANVEFMRSVGEDILPDDQNAIIVVEHPGYIDRDPKKFQFEHNPDSLAYIEHGKGKVYICGGFNGGYAVPYLKMIQTLNKNIQQDLANGIIARWHDESHINRYILDHPYHLLSVGYCYPQYGTFAECETVRIREKICYGGSALLRNQTVPLSLRIRDRIRYLLARLGLLPYLHRVLRLLRGE